MLSQDDEYRLREVLKIADRFSNVAANLEAVVVKCTTNATLKGLDEMVAMAFNAQQYKPSYGAGGGGLPPGKYKGVIVDSRQENVEKNGQVVGGYLALDLTPVEGPLVGQKQIDRLNLHHTNPKTVEIANSQMSAYCHVLNKYQFNDTSELHNIPFWFEIGWQKGNEPTQEKPEGGYTEVKKLFDINGNEPGKAGNGPAVNQQQQQPNIPQGQPAGGVVAQGNGWGGAPQGQQQPNPAIDNNVAIPNQGQPQQGGWGAPQGQQQQQPQQQPAAQQGGGWGAPQGQQGGQPQGGGWAPQGGGQPNAAPAAWGQR